MSPSASAAEEAAMKKYTDKVVNGASGHLKVRVAFTPLELTPAEINLLSRDDCKCALGLIGPLGKKSTFKEKAVVHLLEKRVLFIDLAL